MKRALLLYTRNFVFNTNPNYNNSLARLATATQPRLRFYSSDSDSDKLPQIRNTNASSDFQDVSNQELKRRIEKYLEGDGDAIPSIFEAILSRKLSGKHDQSDDELMEELQIRSKGSSIDALKDDDDGDGDESGSESD